MAPAKTANLQDQPGPQDLGIGRSRRKYRDEFMTSISDEAGVATSIGLDDAAYCRLTNGAQ
jgi:hypothetical protein